MRPFAILLLLLLAAAAQATEFYVATNGSDTNPGTKAKPFATLERARDVLRLMKRGPGATTVWIRGGVYNRTETFTLTAGDGGTEGAEIVYRACEGETVRITGGRQVKGFRPVTGPDALARLDEAARKSVLMADLKAQGITDFGSLKRRGFGGGGTAALELYFDDQPMQIARYPNGEWAKIAGVPDGPQGGKFSYEGDRPSRWKSADDIWVHGYWTWDWAETHEKVKSIDSANRVVATEPPHGVYGYTQGKRFYWENILEELDQPGEFYVDRKAGILYFWPPAPIKNAEVFVSIMETPLVSIEGASQIIFQGITFEHVRGDGFLINGGSQDVIAGCTVRNIGCTGISIQGSTVSGVQSSDLYNIGETGIAINAGDRITLTPGRCFAVNNHIHHFSRFSRTYRPAILIYGVGNRAAHNLMHDAPHSAILFHGNDHVMEFNETHHVCMETSDAGGFYTGRDFSWRGNVIRYNYFHHMGTGDVRSVYIDDCASGMRIYGNVFHKAKMGVCIGGGRDCIVENNLFVDCHPSVFVDARGMNWAKPTVDGYMKQQLEAMPYRTSPWKDRYPELLTLYDDEPGAPKYNRVQQNVSFGGRWLQVIDPICNELFTFKDNMVDADPGFVDFAGEDFRLRDDSPAFKLGFKRIPMEEIGLQKDEYRATTDVGDGVALPPQPPKIKKLGITVCDLVEATPVVFKGKLYRFEYVRDQYYKPNEGKPSYFRFVDMKTGEETPGFAQGYHLGSAFVDGDTAYAFGVNKWDGEKVEVFWSKDLKQWESKTALNLPGWGIFNTSVCKGRDGYIMAFEIGRPAEETGVPFTIRFAESKDCREWKLAPSECVYSKERYTACPAIRYVQGRYYMIYLEAYPGPAYNPCIVRSKDLVKWESSALNPIMHYSIEDKLIANPKLTQEERERIAGAVDSNNSDVDFCEFEGKTHIVYSWGNQQGVEHLAEAVYPGPESEFLKSFFAE